MNNLVRTAADLKLLDYRIQCYICCFLFPNMTDNVIQKMAKDYQLSELEELVLALNYKNIVKNYGREVVTDHRELTTRLDSIGNHFTEELSDEVIDLIKKVATFPVPLTVRDFYSTEKNYMFKINIQKLEKKYPNVRLGHMKRLFDMTKSEEYYEPYLSLLNGCDRKTQELLLEYVTPPSTMMDIQFGEYMSQYELGGHHFFYQKLIQLYAYLDSEEEINEYEKNKEFQLLLRGALDDEYGNFNMYYLKKLQYFYLDQYHLLKKIVKLPNHQEILERFIYFKKSWINIIPRFRNNLVRNNLYESETIETDDYPYVHNYVVPTKKRQQDIFIRTETTGKIDFQEEKLEKWMDSYRRIIDFAVEDDCVKVMGILDDYNSLLEGLIQKPRDEYKEQSLKKVIRYS